MRRCCFCLLCSSSLSYDGIVGVGEAVGGWISGESGRKGGMKGVQVVTVGVVERGRVGVRETKRMSES